MTFFCLIDMKENWRPLQKFVLQHHWKLCTKIQPYAHCKSLRQQTVGKLLSEISRTTPWWLDVTAQIFADASNFCKWRPKKRSQPTATQSHYHPSATQSHYHPSPSLFATTRASWCPFSTATVRWLPKITEKTCQCLFQLTKFGEGYYKPEGGLSIPSTPSIRPCTLSR